MVRSQITKDTTRKIHICKKCLTHFTKEDLLEKHISYCSKNETVAVKMPTKNILKVRDHCHFTGKYRGAAHNDCNLNMPQTTNSSSDISQSPRL